MVKWNERLTGGLMLCLLCCTELFCWRGSSVYVNPVAAEMSCSKVELLIFCIKSQLRWFSWHLQLGGDPKLDLEFNGRVTHPIWPGNVFGSLRRSRRMWLRQRPGWVSENWWMDMKPHTRYKNLQCNWYVSQNRPQDISSISGANPVQLPQQIDIYHRSWILKNIYRTLVFWLVEQTYRCFSTFNEQTFATFTFHCVLVHQWLPGVVTCYILCNVFVVFCNKNVFFAFSTLCVCPAVSFPSSPSLSSAQWWMWLC